MTNNIMYKGDIRVIGGGLAGSEACFRLLKWGYRVHLAEMRRVKMTPCHHTALLAELVCSNSLKSQLDDTASGCLKAELDVLDCDLLRLARQAAVPAGGALAVNRDVFSALVESELSKYDGFIREDREVTEIEQDMPCIIATGPLTSDALAESIKRLTGDSGLNFYDAAAPIISADSIDNSEAFFAVRYNKGDEGDYLNCGMNKDEYNIFYQALVNAESAELKEFDRKDFFEGCMPIEVMAKRGEDTIRYGMLKPKGIINPNNGMRYYAVAQLRKENKEATAYNLVGFQTNLKFKEQERVFRLIPGLENAEFLRYGVMHRNTYLNSPNCLDSTMRYKGDLSNPMYFAGQIVGVEGYVESIMSGLIAAINIDRELSSNKPFIAPNTTIIGALQNHVSQMNSDFQPMNANFGILPPLDINVKDKKNRKLGYAKRAICDIMIAKDSLDRDY